MVGCGSNEGATAPTFTSQVQHFQDERYHSLPEIINSGGQASKPDLVSCLGPIYQLSADVLRSIFELDCEAESHVNFPLRFIPRQFILSQVCSTWQQIMFDIPTFWNKIRITFDKCTRYDKMVEAPRIWLSRAKDLPCFIDFDFIPFHAISSNRHPLWQHDINKNIVRDLISPHRCKSLSVVFEKSHLLDLLHLSADKLSCIEVLRIQYVDNVDNHEATSLFDFHKLSNLTSFAFVPTISDFDVMASGIGCESFDMFSSIPWHQLRHIRLDNELPALRCMDILETSASVLETCLLLGVLEDLSFVSSLSSQIKPVHCPHLRELEIHIHPSGLLKDGESFLLCLRLPKLKSLTLHCPDDSQKPLDPQTLLRMQSVCTMNLEKLFIFDFDCDVDAGALLASMPSLRCLQLPTESMFTVDDIQKLATGSIGPFLEELEICYPRISNEIGELIQMVKARSRIAIETSTQDKIIPIPLRSVVLYCEDHDEALLQKFDAIIHEVNQLGVELTVNFLGNFFD